VKPLAEAQREVLAAARILPAAPVDLAEARGRVLAADVHAPGDVPPFANSAMDGFAVRAADVARAPVALTVVEDVPAGHVATKTVEAGAAIRIMTGAPLPPGADTVVRVEDTAADGNRVRILVPTAAGTAVRAAGCDVVAGSLVFGAGTVLTPAHLGVLAALGVTAPVVRRRPRAAVLSTGDEVSPPETVVLAPGRIRDANRPLLRALLEECGAEVVDLGIVGDDGDRLAATIAGAAEEADAVLTSGGVSVGDHDLVKDVLSRVGEIELWRVAMQPAKPFAFGTVGGTPLFGLPGNPVSALVAFEQFAAPALRTMTGAREVFRPRLTGILGEAVDTDPEKVVFLRVRVRWTEGGPVAVLAGGQGSNVLSAAADADAFAVVPVGVGAVAAGAPVLLEMHRWPPALSAGEVLGV